METFETSAHVVAPGNGRRKRNSKRPFRRTVATARPSTGGRWSGTTKGTPAPTKEEWNARLRAKGIDPKTGTTFGRWENGKWVLEQSNDVGAKKIQSHTSKRDDDHDAPFRPPPSNTFGRTDPSHLSDAYAFAPLICLGDADVAKDEKRSRSSSSSSSSSSSRIGSVSIGGGDERDTLSRDSETSVGMSGPTSGTVSSSNMTTPPTSASANFLEIPSLSAYGWSWDAKLSKDENFMELAYRLSRNSYCVEGHMGCVIVSPPEESIAPADDGKEDGAIATTSDALDRVLATTVNTSLCVPFQSECHAEANAVSACARRGVALRGAACYVTRGPCINCFRLLAMSGVKRIVCPDEYTCETAELVSKRLNVEWIQLRDDKIRRHRRDADAIRYTDDRVVQFMREERKRRRKERHQRKSRERARRAASAESKKGKRERGPGGSETAPSSTG